MAYIGNSPTQVAFLTDSFSGTGSLTTFSMSASPANPASIFVSVHGLLQDPTTYSVSGNTLEFTGAPPAGTGNISVRYMGIPASGVTTTAYRTLTEFTATAGQTTFTPPSYTVGFIAVFRNGVRLGSADYTATNGTTVVLASGATAGDLVTTESFYVSSVLNAIPNTANAVNQLLIADGAISQSKVATGVAGTGPAFSAYSTATQSFSSGTFTKVQYNNETFDTNSNFDSSTNYRFTPTVAGYYQINAIMSIDAGMNYAQITIYKNGSLYKRMYSRQDQGYSANISDVVYFNGSSDYVEIYVNPSTTFTGGPDSTKSVFSGALVRAA